MDEISYQTNSEQNLSDTNWKMDEMYEIYMKYIWNLTLKNSEEAILRRY